MRDASEVIAPCPFCGGQAEIHEVDDDRHDGWRGVGCGKCRCFMAEPGVPDAIAAWNKRATLSAAEPADAGRDAVLDIVAKYVGKTSTIYGYIRDDLARLTRPPSEAAAQPIMCDCHDETQRRLCVMRDKCCRPEANSQQAVKP